MRGNSLHQGARPAWRRRRSTMLGLAIAALVALGLTACGDDKEAQVRETVEFFFTHDKADRARSCELRTGRYLRSTQQEHDLRAALRDCRERAPNERSRLRPADETELSLIEVTVTRPG